MQVSPLLIEGRKPKRRYKAGAMHLLAERKNDMKKGKVYLVGAGPGDIGLITVKGMEAIRMAEVIVYDRLVNPNLLGFAQPGCEFIYCGKLPDRHTLRQEAINKLLVDKASEGKTVVRLKGGDPGVFGRVGEEAADLAGAGIPYEMVPGITSGIAAPLYAGIPVTHREHGSSFALVTAHDKSASGIPSIDWEGLAKGIDTIAFYMGVSNLPMICGNLMKHGKPSDTPVILIQWGTLGRQKTLEGTLENISQLVKEKQFSNPAITLVGEIVALRKQLTWFEQKPLHGRQILLARTGTGDSAIASELLAEGADVVEFPKWKNKVLETGKKKKEVLANLSAFDRYLFTSPESVEYFIEALLDEGRDIRSLTGEVVALSAKSQKALRKYGLLAGLAKEGVKPGKQLVIGDQSVSFKQLQYTAQYGPYEGYITHETVLDESQFPIFKRIFEDSALDTVIFPNSRSVLALIHGLEYAGLDEELLNKLETVCLGEKTKKTADDCGLNVHTLVKGDQTGGLVDYLKKPLDKIVNG